VGAPTGAGAANRTPGHWEATWLGLVGPEKIAAMRTFTAHTTVKGRREDVFVTLIDPDCIRRWSPVDFEVEHLDGDRLEAGGQARVVGRLAGLRVGFDVDVVEADGERLTLVAAGPIDLDVGYRVAPAGDGSEITASVSVRRASGFSGRVLAGATDALLAGGAVEAALGRIARTAEHTELALAC
jgi:hypothetical protein